ncbi:MAG: TRAP transporter small permease subunit [Bacteroidota bacterium]
MNRLKHMLDGISEWSGRIISYLSLALVLLICYDVFRRYIIGKTAVWIYELEWHFFAFLFLVGAAYTLKHDAHVRVDVFYQKWSPKGKAWINLLGAIVFLIPLCMLLIVEGYDFAYTAFEQQEISKDPDGLRNRFIVKAAIPLGAGFLLLQAFSLTLSSLMTLISPPTQHA